MDSSSQKKAKSKSPALKKNKKLDEDNLQSVKIAADEIELQI